MILYIYKCIFFSLIVVANSLFGCSSQISVVCSPVAVHLYVLYVTSELALLYEDGLHQVTSENRFQPLPMSLWFIILFVLLFQLVWRGTFLCICKIWHRISWLWKGWYGGVFFPLSSSFFFGSWLEWEMSNVKRQNNFRKLWKLYLYSSP